MPNAAPETPAGGAEEKAAKVSVPSLKRRVEFVDAFLEETLEQRKLSMRDRDFYDGHQWSKDDLDKLKRRKQPALIKNLIAPKVNTTLGEEILGRVDPVALPRTLQHDAAGKAATDALRFVEEEQRFDSQRSLFAKNFFVEGTGGVIKELEQGSDRVRHSLRHIEWDRLIWDPHSRSALFDDAKYLGILMWMDLEDAIAKWPEAEEALRNALHNDISSADEATSDKPRYSWVDAKRDRVQIAELYVRVDDSWWKTCFTQSQDLNEPEPTGFLDEQGEKHLCPLRMASCYIDREGRRYGIVRNMVSPQEALNKHSSKLLHIITAKPVIAERDTIRDPQQFMTEIAKPDGLAETEPDALTEGRVKVLDQLQLATAHLQLVQEAKADINGIGPAASQIPDMPQSASGRALLARRQEASKEIGNPFDTISQWTKGVFELDWLCIRHHWTEEMWLRVTDDEQRTGYRFVALNRKLTRAQRLQELLGEGVPIESAITTAAGNMASVVMRGAQQQMQQYQQMNAMRAQQTGQQPPEMPPDAMNQIIMGHPLMSEVITDNQVDQMLMDIIIDEAPETAVLQSEEFEKWTNLVPSLVQGGLDPREAAKITVELSQFRERRRVMDLLSQPPDPQQAQMQQQQQQMMMQQAQVGIAKTQSEAQLNVARTASEQAKVQIMGAKAPSEIEKNQASAMRDAAHAGERSGGAMPMQGVPMRGGHSGMMGGM